MSLVILSFLFSRNDTRFEVKKSEILASEISIRDKREAIGEIAINTITKVNIFLTLFFIFLPDLSG
jgi:hypothetical protein